MAKSNTISYVRSHSKIKEAIKTRMAELNLKYTDIITDAAERGCPKITKPGLSRYLNGKDSGQLTEEQVVWMCIRYDIPIVLIVGIPKIDANNKLTQELPKYNEARALSTLKKYING